MISLSKLSRGLFFLLVFIFFFAPLTWLLLASINGNPTYGYELPDPATLSNYGDLFAEGMGKRAGDDR